MISMSISQLQLVVSRVLIGGGCLSSLLLCLLFLCILRCLLVFFLLSLALLLLALLACLLLCASLLCLSSVKLCLLHLHVSQDSVSLSLCIINRVRNQNVVKDGSSLNLPQLKSSPVQVVILVQLVIRLVIRVVNHFCLPFSLVCWVVNHSWAPFSLVIWIWNLRCLPFAVLLIIPILWFGCIRISNEFWLIVPVRWLFVLWICNLWLINPVSWLLVLWIWNDFWWKEIPVLL
mmetsp:Transcript_10972/g.40862  ORF Transcript_10972/g.40862 Transcript_10972/m.40862 type:complete len:233 (+) Transcript_10972:505-1203(+)